MASEERFFHLSGGNVTTPARASKCKCMGGNITTYDTNDLPICATREEPAGGHSLGTSMITSGAAQDIEAPGIAFCASDPGTSIVQWPIVPP
jgi:hypothetical protein